MLCEFGEILLIVAASCEQTITNRVTGEIITLIDNQGDRSNRTRLGKAYQYLEEYSGFQG